MAVTLKSMPKGGKREGAGRPRGQTEPTITKGVRFPLSLHGLVEDYAQEHSLNYSQAVIQLLKCKLEK